MMSSASGLLYMAIGSSRIFSSVSASLAFFSCWFTPIGPPFMKNTDLKREGQFISVRVDACVGVQIDVSCSVARATLIKRQKWRFKWKRL